MLTKINNCETISLLELRVRAIKSTLQGLIWDYKSLAVKIQHLKWVFWRSISNIRGGGGAHQEHTFFVSRSARVTGMYVCTSYPILLILLIIASMFSKIPIPGTACCVFLRWMPSQKEGILGATTSKTAYSGPYVGKPIHGAFVLPLFLCWTRRSLINSYIYVFFWRRNSGDSCKSSCLNILPKL